MAKTVRITKTVEFGSSISNSDTISLTVSSPGTIDTSSVTVQDIQNGDLDVIVSDDVTQITATISSGTCVGESTTITITDNTISPTPTISVTPSSTPSATPGASQTPSPSDTPSVSVTPTISTSQGVSPTPTISVTPTISDTPAPSDTPSVSVTPTISDTPAPSDTPSVSVTPTISDTPAPSATPSISVSTSATATNCHYVFVPDTQSTTGFGLRYYNGGEVNTPFSSLLGVSSYEGGVNGTVYGVCSTIAPNWWIQSGNVTDVFPDGVYIIGTGDSCSVDIDCVWNSTPPPASATPSATPSITPTPSTSTVFYSYTTVFSSTSELEACGVVSPTTTLYSTCSSITVGCILNDSQNVFDYAANGWYHDINTGTYYYVEGNGYVAETGVCSAPSPTPTPSTSTAPCTALLMQDIGSATSSAACSGASATVTRGHNGLLSAPGVGDTIYARDTCAATFNGGNLWYFLGDDTSAIRISSSGEVLEKFNC